MIDLKKIDEWFDSEEGKKSIADFAEKIEREERIKTKQLQRLHESGNFLELTEKAIEKYNSDDYIDSWYKRGVEPPESLFWFLFEYAEKYGRECEEQEWEQYGNMFTSSLFFVNGYYFNRMDGQGSVIKVVKAECSNCN